MGAILARRGTDRLRWVFGLLDLVRNTERVSVDGPLNRRRFVTGLLALGAAGLAAGCSGGDLFTGSRTPLRFWNLFGGGDGVNMLAMIDAFRQANPDVDVEAATLAWGPPYYTKLAMAAAGGRAPDLAIMHLSRLPAYAPPGLLDPIDVDLLGEFGVRPTDFPPNIWAQAQHDGRAYAVPLDTHPFVMYYNVDVCRQAGLLDADGTLRPLSGPDQLIAAFLAAKKVTGAHPRGRPRPARRGRPGNAPASSSPCRSCWCTRLS
jgi:multiple sugar transport system substrate-binding protein